MNSRHSESLVLVWRVAAKEARHLRSPEIEPQHLFLGLCKVVDLEIPELVSRKTPNRDEILEEFLREVRRLRNVFKLSGVDPKILRRKLRLAYGMDSLDIVEEGVMHRSDAAKQVFSIAERFGDMTGFVVFPVHLLHAVLGFEDVKRDSTLAGMRFDKEALVRNAKEEMFSRENVDVIRKAARKILLN